jgi:hypothetical protein
MIEVASGNILVGIKYTIGNISTPPGTGTVTYNSVTYAIGSSFVGQAGVTTYTTTLTAKVYEDDTEVNIINQITAELEDEISPYPEDVEIIVQVTAENFNESEEIRYPEDVLIVSQITAEAFMRNKSQIVRKNTK